MFYFNATVNMIVLNTNLLTTSNRNRALENAQEILYYWLQSYSDFFGSGDGVASGRVCFQSSYSVQFSQATHWRTCSSIIHKLLLLPAHLLLPGKKLKLYGNRHSMCQPQTQCCSTFEPLMRYQQQQISPVIIDPSLANFTHLQKSTIC